MIKLLNKLLLRRHCNVCGHVSSNELNVCPNCGNQLHNKNKGSKIHLDENTEAIIIIALMTVALAYPLYLLFITLSY